MAPSGSTADSGRTSAEPWSTLVARALGPVTPGASMGAGLRRVTAGGRELVVKVGAAAPDEAAGLRSLAGVDGAPPVPDVVLAQPNLLVTTWVEPGRRTPAAEELLGHLLAALHSAPWPEWGGGSSWIGDCPVDPVTTPDAATFYGRRLTELASRCGLERPIAGAVDRLAELLPSGGPSLLHGDLWWGNVLWGADGRPWLIDPSAHGGCPEEDLAMLALFGPVPERTHRAYEAVRPLAAGWEDRVALFQLVPLLVHTVLFGGGYRWQVMAALDRLG